MKSLLLAFCWGLPLAADVINCQTGVEPGCAPVATYSVANSSGVLASGAVTFSNADVGAWYGSGSWSGPAFLLSVGVGKSQAVFTPGDLLLSFHALFTNLSAEALTVLIEVTWVYGAGPYAGGTINGQTTGNLGPLTLVGSHFLSLDENGNALARVGTGCAITPTPEYYNCGAVNGPIGFQPPLPGPGEFSLRFAAEVPSLTQALTGLNVAVDNVPEPATAGLVGGALLAVLCLRRRC